MPFFGAGLDMKDEILTPALQLPRTAWCLLAPHLHLFLTMESPTELFPQPFPRPPSELFMKPSSPGGPTELPLLEQAYARRTGKCRGADPLLQGDVIQTARWDRRLQVPDGRVASPPRKLRSVPILDRCSDPAETHSHCPSHEPPPLHLTFPKCTPSWDHAGQAFNNTQRHTVDNTTARRRETSTYWAIPSATYLCSHLIPRAAFQRRCHPFHPTGAKFMVVQGGEVTCQDNNLATVKQGFSPSHHLTQHQESRALALQLTFTVHCYMTLPNCTSFLIHTMGLSDLPTS